MFQRVVTSGFIVYINKFLIVKRADNDSFHPSEWEIPGGKLEFGEKVDAGLKRELREEVGLDVKVISPISVWEYENPHKQTQYIEIDFLCVVESEEVKLSEEHSDFAWVTFADLTKYDMSPEARKSISDLKSHPLLLNHLK